MASPRSWRPSMPSERLLLFAVLGSLVLLPSRPALSVLFSGNINEYADQCACELGGGPGAYMPTGVMPNHADSKEIPVYWNEKQISFVETAPGTWEYLFAGMPGVANSYPAPDNTTGRIFNKADLKCDYWPHVESVNTHCIPGQRSAQIKVGDVTWTFLWRREQPPKPGHAPWDAFHPNYHIVMDVNAYNSENEGVCWFDTLNSNESETFEWWVPAPGTGVPPGLPRPGGKHPDKMNRAAGYWDTPAQMQGEPCTGCHGNGPLLTPVWLSEENVPVDDDTERYWNAAELFAQPEMFDTAGAAGKVSCGAGCHDLWTKGSSTCPGGDIASAMTTTPTKSWASDYRLQTGVAPPDLAIQHEMPEGQGMDASALAEYATMKDCCTAGTGCNNLKTADIPNFYGPQGPVPADPKQLIPAPDPALNYTLEKINCIFDGDGAETCEYRVKWDDPTDDYNAPDDYFLEVDLATNAPGTDPSTPDYCASNTPAGGVETPITGDPWRKMYEVTDSLAACQKLEVRLCGGHCADSALSKDIGQVKTVSTACAVTPEPPTVSPPVPTLRTWGPALLCAALIGTAALVHRVRRSSHIGA